MSDVDPDAVGGPAAGARGRPVHLRPSLVAVVALGGLVGAPLRYAVAQWLPGPSSGWPTATFATNLVGALVLGVLLEALARSGEDAGARRLLRLGLGTGLVGAFTTYSTLALEVDDLATSGRVGTAVAYGLASAVAGVSAAAAGVALGARLGRRR